MQPRSLLVLTVVVLALGGFIFFYEKELPSTDERAEHGKKVLGLEADEVSAVVIEPKDGTHVRLEKETPVEAEEKEKKEEDAFAPAPVNEWRIVEPLAARADRTRADDLVRTLVGLEKRRTLEDLDRKETGLDAPRYRVRLATKKGETTFAVGGEVPASKDVFVALGDDGPVFQVASAFVESLGRTPGDWRDRKVFPGSRTEVERVRLRTAGGEVLLARRGEGFWIESPLTDRAEESKANELLTRLTDLEVTDFVDAAPADPATLGLAPPVATIEVVRKDRADAFVVELGAVVPGTTEATPPAADPTSLDATPSPAGTTIRYARAGGQLFTTKSELLASAESPAAAWRSHDWTAEQVFRVEKATFVDAQGEVVVRRDGAEWKRGDDRIDYSTASDVLYAVTDVTGSEVLDTAAAATRGLSLATPELTVTLELQEEGKEVLKLFAAPGGGAAATAEGRDAVLLVGAEAATKLRDALAKVRTAEKQPDPDEKADEDAAEADDAEDAEPDDASAADGEEEGGG